MHMIPQRFSARVEVLIAFIAASLLSLVFYLYRIVDGGSFIFSFLPLNLLLSWIPLALSIWLVAMLRTKAWSSWAATLLSLLWLAFLPNSFYMITDYIHLQEVTASNVLYDTVLFSMFIFTSLLLGFSSLYLVHLEFYKRLGSRSAAYWIAGILLVCSIAVYIGRDLRWNSWDILLNPAGLLFDISDRFIRISAYREMLVTLLSFYVLLCMMYVAGWRILRLARIIEPRRLD